MRWADLEPPQEPEAVLLPRPSQVLSSEPAAMPWGSGRRVTPGFVSPPHFQPIEAARSFHQI